MQLQLLDDRSVFLQTPHFVWPAPMNDRGWAHWQHEWTIGIVLGPYALLSFPSPLRAHLVILSMAEG